MGVTRGLVLPSVVEDRGARNEGGQGERVRWD